MYVFYRVLEQISRSLKAKGPVQKELLYKKLEKFQMAGNQDMAEYLKKIKGAEGQVERDVIGVQDELIAIILLTSLPSRFENFIIAMETRDKLSTFHELKLKLLEEAERERAP